jgi:hypothetical protein
MIVYTIALPMKETYKPIILARRAKKAGVEVPKPINSKVEFAKALGQNIIKPLHMLAIEVWN